MTETEEDTSVALILSKKDTGSYVSVTVQCPFCPKKHTHGLVYGETEGFRVSHCHQGSYTIKEGRAL
jgi:hypothetical protein